MDRRHFLKASAMFSAGGLLGSNPIQSHGDGAKKITIRTLSLDGVKTRLAARELLSGLRALKSPGIIVETAESGTAFEITLTVDASRFKQTEDYEIARTSRGAAFHASTEQALLYAVFDFLERQGMVFGIDGAMAPIDPPNGLHLPEQGQPWNASPRFGVRGLLPWPDFLNCISIYNDEDFKAYFAAMLRMRLNMFGMHVYTENIPRPMAESYLIVRVCRQLVIVRRLKIRPWNRGAICRRELRNSRWARRDSLIPTPSGPMRPGSARIRGTLPRARQLCCAKPSTLPESSASARESDLSHIRIRLRLCAPFLLRRSLIPEDSLSPELLATC